LYFPGQKRAQDTVCSLTGFSNIILKHDKRSKHNYWVKLLLFLYPRV